MDSLHKGREAGFRAAQDEERGRGAGAGDTGEEEEIKTGGSCIEFLAWFMALGRGLYQVLKDNDIDFRRKYAEGEIIPVQELRP